MIKNIDFTIYSDGGARGNPGEAAYGFLIFDKNKKLIFKTGKRIGVATNNVAEYMGIISSLAWIDENVKEKNILIKAFVDSELIAMQLSGVYRVKDKKLKELFTKAKNLENKIEAKMLYVSIPRDQNSQADQLVNKALDSL